VVIPVQCLGELFRVLTTKAGRSRADAQEAVLSWMDSYPLVETSSDVWRGAMDLCVAHQMSSWDALVLNAAAVAASLKEAFRPCPPIPALLGGLAIARDREPWDR
jgi:predicted nucleic acid-binding protein